MDREDSFGEFGSSMNAFSLGFVATAILISMFLIMAIFEHLLSARTSIPSSQYDSHASLETGQTQTQLQSLGKLRNSHPVTTSYQPNFSVLMPGQLYPTYLARPAPLPCPREAIYWPPHDHHAFASP